MGKKETVDALVEGGKATAAPPLGPALGPMGVNIGQVISKINEKTSAFKGMKVPVKVLIDTETKAFDIEVGTPPVSQLIMKELGVESGSGTPNLNKVGNIGIEQAIKIAKMKKDSMFVNSLKSAVKCVVGSCNSCGVLVEGLMGSDMNAKIEKGDYDNEIKAEKTEPSEDKKNYLKSQLAEINTKLAAAAAKALKDKEAAAAAEGPSPAAKAEEAKKEGAPAEGAPVAGADKKVAAPGAKAAPGADKKAAPESADKKKVEKK